MPRRILQGTVVSDSADKTVLVRVERRIKHPLYKKYMTKSKKYPAHDEGNKHKVGDKVRIQECRPISKRKCWMILGEAVAGAQSKAKSEAAAGAKSEAAAGAKSEAAAGAKSEAAAGAK